jgi:hypothetical protein
MTEDYESVLKNYMWDIVSRPKGKSIVTSKCIYKIKHVADGSVEKYKAIFVARGFSQVEGIYYEEKFSRLDRYTSIRMIIISCHIHGLETTSHGCEDNLSQW